MSTVTVPTWIRESGWGLRLLGLAMVILGILALTGQPNPAPPVVVGLFLLIDGFLIAIGW
jgi:uncharacterized membrane protein HdeD (DUF308 family)